MTRQTTYLLTCLLLTQALACSETSSRTTPGLHGSAPDLAGQPEADAPIGALGTCAGEPGGSPYCGTACPCSEGVGDCDSDAECAPGLVCADNVGAYYGWAADVDVCQSVCSRTGDDDFDCTPGCPCTAGEGDCDDDGDCEPGLWCLFDAGASHGYSDPDVDVCVAGCPALGAGANNFCTPECPCTAGEGDCDRDSECEPGLDCVHDVGIQYGFDAETDVCLQVGSIPVCGNGMLEGAEICDDGNAIDDDGCDSDCVHTIRDISMSQWHTCIVTRSGRLACWGFDARYILGYDLPIQHIGDDETPASVGFLNIDTPVVSVLAEERHTCVLLDTGAVRCWGQNPSGVLGYGHRQDYVMAWDARDVDLGGRAVQITGAYGHTCALLDTGDVKCWGGNYQGQLGYGIPNLVIGDDETPASVGPVPLGGKAVQIAAGIRHTCALMDTGAVRCWGGASEPHEDGYDVGTGQLGYGNMEDIGDDETPASVGDVPLGGRALAITAGWHRTCALMATGGVRCWGSSWSILGYGNREAVGDDETPAEVGDVPLGGPAIGLADNATEHNCALMATGAVKCWGQNRSGQLGYGHTRVIGDDELPSSLGTVSLGAKAIRVETGGAASCALLATGGLRCWGYNRYGQLGYGHILPIGDNEVPSSVGTVPAFP